MGPQDDGAYEFGPFRLDVGDRLLWQERTTVPLEPTQFEVLTLLVHQAGHLVTRDDLIRAVWKDTYVDGGSLTVTISMSEQSMNIFSEHRDYRRSHPS